jgi:histone H3/H4
MKKTTEKSASKAKKKTVRNLDVKPAKGGTIRGGKGKEKWI